MGTVVRVCVRVAHAIVLLAIILGADAQTRASIRGGSRYKTGGLSIAIGNERQSNGLYDNGGQGGYNEIRGGSGIIQAAEAAVGQIASLGGVQTKLTYSAHSKPSSSGSSVATKYEEHQDSVMVQQDDADLKYDNHIYYKSAFITNLQSFNEHWSEITKSKPVRIPGSRNTRRRDIAIKLTFDFPLRGHILRSITIANGGFINLAGDSQLPSQYIAPLMADFDNRTTTVSGIKLYDDGMKFSAIWENIPLADDRSKTFTFAATLYKNGDIIFAYKDIPISVQTEAFNVGISDKIETTRESYNVGFNYPFSSGTLLKLIPILSQDVEQNIPTDEKVTANLENSLIEPDQDLANLKYETYAFYKTAFIGNVEFFNQYWSGLARGKPLRPTWKKNSGRYEVVIELSFDFPYYNRYLRSITITTGGYILLGDESQYIAPLWADFEIPNDVNSAVKIYEDGDKFIVIWDSLYLKGKKDNIFTFALILFKSGEIVYLYKHIPGSIQIFYDLGYELRFGLSDGKDEAQQIQLKNYDVSSGTLFKILSLQTLKARPTKNEISKVSTELVLADEDVSKLNYQSYTSYKIAFIGNLEYFNNYWLQLFKTQPLKKIWRRNAFRYETTVDLSFEFLFYGKPLRHLIVSTGGYIIFGDDEEDGRALNHYIAPLAADFDDSSTAQKVRLYDDGEKFSAIWDNVQLRNDKSKTFTFVVTIYKTGDIVFTYKYLSLSIQHLHENDKDVKVGFADLTDESDTSHRVLLNNYDIATATILKIETLDYLKEDKELGSVDSLSTEPSFTEKEIITSTTSFVSATHPVQPLGVPKKSQQLVSAATNPENLQYETYDSYKASLILNPEYFRNLWNRITEFSQPVKTNWTKDLNRYETVIELSFDFPFYDRSVRKIKVTSAGFIIMGDHSQDFNFKQYIAPLMADFDENLFDPSSVKISADAEKIIVLWSNLALRTDKDKLFTFAVTLYRTGEIEFIYKYIAMTIQLLGENDKNVKVGISDLINDIDDTRKIKFNNYDISSESVLKIISLVPVSKSTAVITTTTLPSTNAPMTVLHSVDPLEAPKSLKLIKAASSPMNVKYEIYPSYKVGLIYNPEYFNDYWSLISKSEPVKLSWTKKIDHYETVIDLLFDFYFYDRPLRNLKVTSAGYIFVGDNDEEPTLYIAPLKADFDESKFNPNSVRIFQDKEKLSVIWDNLPLRSDKTKTFTFGVTFYKNGDITFVYKYISVDIQLLYENDSDTIVGFSDLIEDSATEPREVEFKNYEILSGSVLKILSLSSASTDSPAKNTYTSLSPSGEPVTHGILPLDESSDNQNLIFSVFNPTDITYTNYNYYKAGLITNPEYFSEIWMRTLAMKPLRTNWNENVAYYETMIELQFEFPYYGHLVRNLTVTNAGFIILSGEEGDLQKYISPLMADFDQTLFKENLVQLFEDNEKFIVIWEQLHLQSDTTKIFTFGLILYENGDIDFLYKYISQKIPLLYENDHNVVVGISDLSLDKSGERREISFNNYDINSNSVLKISPLVPTQKSNDREPLIGNKEQSKPEKIIEEQSTYAPTTARPFSNIHFVTAEDNLMNLKFVDHSFYRSTYIGNKPHYNEYWTEVKKTTPHKVIWQKTVHPYETQYELSFDFPFYDFIIRNISITSGGFILLGDHLQPDGAVVKQYIAPFMSEFDDLLFREDSVKFLDDGKKFIVLWENMYLREDHEKPFTFAAILYKNGDITFVYENIPIKIQEFYESQQLVKVGISDDYLSDPSRWLTFMNYDIENQTVLKLIATFTPYTTPESHVIESSVLSTQASYIEPGTNFENNKSKATTSNVPYTNSPPSLTTYSKQDENKPLKNKLIISSTTQTLLDGNQLVDDIIQETQNYINQFNQVLTTPVTNELNNKLSNEKLNLELTNADNSQDLRFQFQSHHLYKSVMIKNPEYFDDHWGRISKSRLVKYSWHKTPFGYETTLDPSFDLPFYDIILPKLTVNSAGFINLNDYLLRENIDVMQYIAPLKGDFDIMNVNENSLKIYDDNEKLSFVWENLPLKKDKTKTFTFALTLYVNGDIIFAYKQIPIPINTSDGTFDIGISAAYINENNDYDVNQEISFKNYDIDSGSILAIIALPLLNESSITDPVIKQNDSPFLQNMSLTLSSMLLDSMTTTIEPKPTNPSSEFSHIPTTEILNSDEKSSTKSIKLSTTSFVSTTDKYPDDSSTPALLQTPSTFVSLQTTPSTVSADSTESYSIFTNKYTSVTEAGNSQSTKNQPLTGQIEENSYIHQEEFKVPSSTPKSYTTPQQSLLKPTDGIPQVLEDLVKPQENVVSLKFKPHNQYQSALISNILYFEEYWANIHEANPIKKVWKRSQNGYETMVDLDFEFPFYDRILRNITVNSKGYIDLGNELETTVQQYITPLMVEFEDTNDKNVKLYNDDNKFSVVWENLRLKSDKSKSFSFSVTLYGNGDIVFGYKDLPVSVQKLNNGNKEVHIGVSDAHVSGNNDERHLMTFTNYDIASGSILKISYIEKKNADNCKEQTEINDGLASTTNHINKKIKNDLSLTFPENKSSVEPFGTTSESVEGGEVSTTPLSDIPLVQHINPYAFKEKETLAKESDDSQQEQSGALTNTRENTESSEIIEATTDLDNLKYQTYGMYKVAFIGKPEYFNQHWSLVTKSRPIRQLGGNSTHRSAKLSFDFPFFGKSIRNIVVSSDGLIDLSNEDAVLLTYYIAPLMAKFDPKAVKPSTIKFHDDDDKFTITWENLHLQQDAEQIFTFAVTLYKNGEITFAYKIIPSLLTLTENYKVGISDKINSITFNNYNIVPGTILKFVTETQDHNEPKNAPVEEAVQQKASGRTRGKPTTSTTTTESPEEVEKPVSRLPGRRRPTKPKETPVKTDNDKKSESDVKTPNSNRTSVKESQGPVKSQLIRAAENPDIAKFDTYDLYKVALIGNTKYFNDHWLSTMKSRPIRQTEGSLTRRKLQLTFDFPFRGRIIKNIVITGEGYIDLSGSLEEDIPKVYIAPLFGKFDLKAIKPTSIKLYDDGEKFTAIWENIYFKEEKTNLFTFAVTLYKNGDIAFAYKNIPMPLQHYFNAENEIKIGIYDAIGDVPYTLFFTNYDITSTNIMRIISLSNEPTDVRPEFDNERKIKVISKAGSTTSSSRKNKDSNENVPISNSKSRGRPNISSIKTIVSKSTELPDNLKLSSQTPKSLTLDDERTHFVSTTASSLVSGATEETIEDVSLTSTRLRGRPKFNGLRGRASSTTEIPSSTEMPFQSISDNQFIKETSTAISAESGIVSSSTEEVIGIPITKQNNRGRPKFNGIRGRVSSTSEIPSSTEFAASTESGIVSSTTEEITKIPLANQKSRERPKYNGFRGRSTTEIPSSTESASQPTKDYTSTTKKENKDLPLSSVRLRGRPKIISSTSTEASGITETSSPITQEKKSPLSDIPLTVGSTEAPLNTRLREKPKFTSMRSRTSTMTEPTSAVTPVTETLEEEKNEPPVTFTTSSQNESSSTFTNTISNLKEGQNSQDTDIDSTIGIPDLTLHNDETRPEKEVEEESQTLLPLDTDNNAKTEFLSTNTLSTNPTLSTMSKDLQNKVASTTESNLEISEYTSQGSVTVKEVDIKAKLSRPRFSNPRLRTLTTAETTLSLPPDSSLLDTKDNSAVSPKKQTSITESSRPEENNEQPIAPPLFSRRPLPGLRAPGRIRGKTVVSTEIPDEINEDLKKSTLSSSTGAPDTSTKVTGQKPRLTRPKIKEPQSNISEISQQTQTETSESPAVSTSQRSYRPNLRLPARNQNKPIVSLYETQTNNNDQEFSLEINKDDSAPRHEKPISSTVSPSHDKTEDKNEQPVTPSLLPKRPGLRAPGRVRGKVVTSTTIIPDIVENDQEILLESQKDDSTPNHTEQSSPLSNKPEGPEDLDEQQITSSLFPKRPLPGLRAPGNIRGQIKVNNENLKNDYENYRTSTISSTTEAPDTSTRLAGLRPRLSRPKIGEPQPKKSEISSPIKTEKDRPESPVSSSIEKSNKSNMRLPARNLSKNTLTLTENPIADEHTIKENGFIDSNKAALPRPKITGSRSKTPTVTEENYLSDVGNEKEESQRNPKDHVLEADEPEPKNEATALSEKDRKPPRKLLPGGLIPGRSRGRIIQTSTIKPVIATNLNSEPGISGETDDGLQPSTKESYKNPTEDDNKETDLDHETTFKPDKRRLINEEAKQPEIIQNNLKVAGSSPKNAAGSQVKITGFKTRVTGSLQSPSTVESQTHEAHFVNHNLDNVESTHPLVTFRRPGDARGKIVVTSINNESPGSADVTLKENEDSTKSFSANRGFPGLKTRVIGAKISKTSEIEEEDHDSSINTDRNLKTGSTLVSRTIINNHKMKPAGSFKTVSSDLSRLGDVEEHPVGTIRLTGKIGDNNGLSGGSLSGGRYKISGIRRIITPGTITTQETNESSNDAHEITSEELTGDEGTSKTIKITGTRVVPSNIQSKKDSSENNGEVDSAEIIDASKLASGAFINNGRRISGRFQVTGIPRGLEELIDNGDIPEEHQEMLKSAQFTQQNIKSKLKDDGLILGNGRQRIAYKITGSASGGSEQEVADLIKSKVIPDLINSSKLDSNVESGPLTDENLNDQLNSRSFVVQAQQPIFKRRRQKINYGG